MFDFGNANKGQQSAITTSDGPVLIIAGPGTGKTYTLVQRTIYLIQECGVKPEEIFIATFTEKAAKELLTRVTNALAEKNIVANVNEMYIGTFHSLCLRILKDNLEYTRLKKNYRLMDDFDQCYMVYQNMERFNEIENYELALPYKSKWYQAQIICKYVGRLAEELVEPDELIRDDNPSIVTVGNVYKEYYKLLDEENLLDFAAIQTECYKLLLENKTILEKLQSQIKYIMIDEYQDTNFIQEQLVFLLGDKHKNICVVGDDDQGLYRFRGATIRNILEFPNKFEEGQCKIIHLDINYRSNSGIVDFYNKWMKTTDCSQYSFSWDKFRYDKTIKPFKKQTVDSPTAVTLSSINSNELWHKKILNFIIAAKESGKLTDYNQIAFLFNSVKNSEVISLAQYLEKNGINVYSPRSDMFFKRDEIKLSLGLFMLLFPQYIVGLENGEYAFLKNEYSDYYKSCISFANSFLIKTENEKLCQWIRKHGIKHNSLKGTTDYAYSGLMYQMFAFEPFKTILAQEINSGVVDIRPTRNLALLTQIIGKFEYLHRIEVLNGKYVKRNTEQFFNTYLKLLIEGGMQEYEDDSEYAPSGCVSFMTIHQSKGMEFPIVFVGSLNKTPRNQNRTLLNEIEPKYFKRPAFEPYSYIRCFDLWRLYYTAFSRAQDLLVLTCNEDKKSPSVVFSRLFNELPSTDDNSFDLDEFDFKTIKDVNLKNTFSFTSHISVYENCALQYKFYKELEFLPVRQGAMIFGTLVHETIEDIHRAVLRNEEETITKNNITEWFNNNYLSLIKSEHTYLAEGQLKTALSQVINYAKKQSENWSAIKEAEVDVSLVKPEYIIEGKIDLVKGEGDTVEIVDFKTEKKPDIFESHDRLEHYRRQLNIYAYLIEKRKGLKVSKMNLYYTGEENGSPLITFPYTKTAIEGTMTVFDETVHKILNKEFSHCAESIKICKNCDFRFYCHK